MSTKPPAPASVSQRLIWALCTGGGLGYARFAPGTWGTLPGFLLVPLVDSLPNVYVKAAVLAALGLIAVPIATWGEKFFQTKDPSPVVIDEIVSLPLTCAFAPISLAYLGIGFVVNRIMDILKPPPARQLQSLRSGWGIVIDDMFSGLYAGIVLLLVHRFLGGWIIQTFPDWMTRTLSIGKM